MKPAAELIGKSDFARLRGVSPAAVSKAISSGRIAAAVVTRGGRELLDLAMATDLWQRNTLAQEVSAVDPPGDDVADLNTSRRRLLHHRATLAELEALQRRGELVPVSEVRAEAFTLARAVRDALLSLPDRVAPLLAATADPRQCHQLLTAEITVALRSLAESSHDLRR